MDGNIIRTLFIADTLWEHMSVFLYLLMREEALWFTMHHVSHKVECMHL